MPTPFMHLAAAQRLAKRPALLDLLSTLHPPSWLLGHTAPDVINLSSLQLQRTHTHFFEPQNTNQLRQAPHQAMLEASPSFQNPGNNEQFSFLLGVFSHLIADVVWSQQIGPRFFDVPPEQKDQRKLRYNLFRAWYDEQVRTQLPDDIGFILAQAESTGWYEPLIPDHALHRWRDELTEQFRDNRSNTIPIFAQRSSISPETFQAYLAQEDWMNDEVFSLCAKKEWEAYWHDADLAMEQVILQTQFQRKQTSRVSP